MAGRGECGHEFWAADLGFGEFDGGADVAELEIIDEFVVAGESARGAGEFGGVVPVDELADFAPFIAAPDDGIANLQQSGRLGMPEPTGGETSARLKVEIEAGGVDVFPAMREPHGDVSFIGPLVGGKASVAVDAEQGSAGGAGIGDQVWTDFVEWAGEFGDELDGGLVGAGFVFVFVRLEPVAIVIALEAGEEAEEVGSEVRRHGNQARRDGRESKAG